MVDPERFDDLSAPALRGHELGAERLRVLYRDACTGTLDRWYGGEDPWAG